MLQISFRFDFKTKAKSVMSGIFIFRSKSFPKIHDCLDSIPAGTIQSFCKYQSALLCPT